MLSEDANLGRGHYHAKVPIFMQMLDDSVYTLYLDIGNAVAWYELIFAKENAANNNTTTHCDTMTWYCIVQIKHRCGAGDLFSTASAS